MMKIFLWVAIIAATIDWSYGMHEGNSALILRHRIKRSVAEAEAVTGIRSGIDIAGKISEGITAAYSLRDVGKNMMSTLSKVSTMLGPALGGIGIAFSLFASLAGAQSEDFEKIKLEFAKVHQRFDQLSKQINVLSDKIDYYRALDAYKPVSVDLENVRSAYKDLIDVPKSGKYQRAFKRSCDDPEVNPKQALERLYNLIVKPKIADPTSFVTPIIDHFKLDYKSIMGVFGQITADAYELASLRTACFAFGEKDVALGHATDKAAFWVREIIKELAKVEKQFTNFKRPFKGILQKDLADVLAKDKSIYPKAEAWLRAKCARTKNTASDQASEVCNGDDSVKTQASNINAHLKLKYSWFKWFIVVYKNAADGDTCQSKRAVQAKSGDFNVYAVWSNGDTDQVEQGQGWHNDLKTFIPREDPWCMFNRGGALDSLAAIDNKIKDQPNKILCVIVGNYGKGYARSIVTSDLGTFRTTKCLGETHDFIVGFYSAKWVGPTSEKEKSPIIGQSE